MVKHLLRKLVGSLLHSKRGSHHRHSSHNYHAPQMNRRHSSSDRGGYGHNQQGHQYYKNRGRSSS